MSKILGKRHPLNDAIVWAGFMRAEMGDANQSIDGAAYLADKALVEYCKRWESVALDLYSAVMGPAETDPGDTVP